MRLQSFLTIAAIAAISGCRPQRAPVTASGQLTGAVAPRLAVEQFLGAVRAQDLQALSVVWGTEKGPIRDDRRVSRSELEQRELIMIRCFTHSEFRIVDEQQALEGRRVFKVALTNRGRVKEPNFHTVMGPSDRWYVENAEIAAVKEFCQQ